MLLKLVFFSLKVVLNSAEFFQLILLIISTYLSLILSLTEKLWSYCFLKVLSNMPDFVP